MIWWDGKFSILWCQKHIILHEIASRKVGLIKDYGCDNMDILQSRVVAWASRGAGGEFIKSMLQRKKHNLVLPWPHSLSSACPHNFLGLFTSPLQCRHSLVPIKGHVPNKQLEDNSTGSTAVSPPPSKNLRHYSILGFFCFWRTIQGFFNWVEWL